MGRQPWLVYGMAFMLGCGQLVPDDSAPVAETQGESREIVSRLTGDSPNFAQMSNGSLLSVVSRDFGRGAKTGALVELYYPHYAQDHLWDSYVGVTQGGGHRWAHDLRLVEQTLVPDTGIAVTTLEAEDYRLILSDWVRPHDNAHIRQVTLTNTSGALLRDAQLTFTSFFTLHHLPGGDRLTFDRTANGLIQVGKKAAVAVVADRPADEWQCGYVNLPFSKRQDARMAAERGALPGNSEAGPFPSGVNGAMRHRLGDLRPGQQARLTYVIGMGTTADQALQEANSALRLGDEALQQEEAGFWREWLSRAKMPALSADALQVYRRALVTLKQHTVDNGAIIAAPTNLNPPYRLVWPRDGSLIALTLLEAGFAEEARRFFPFLERVQKRDGGFAINFFPDGSRALWDFGTDGNEHDQVGLYAWGVSETFKATGDSHWLAERWPHVKRAADFLMKVQRQDGLLGTCRDLWELHHDGSWTFSNAAGWAGLRSAAMIARQMGDPSAAAAYDRAALRLHGAVLDQLVADGRFARGLRKKGLDTSLEIANLALGEAWLGFVPERDARLVATGEAIAENLSTAWGGIRRYQGDRYYGGQPWPVATGWLALHLAGAGDRTGARRLFDTLTRYAQQTPSLMLGEQFDEEKGRWVSAFPLAWSEATYVRTALQLSRH